MQPVASDDVAAALADVAVEEPLNGMVRAGGSRTDTSRRTRPTILERKPRRTKGDHRRPALYFGIELNDQSLTPGDNPRIGPTRFEDWLSRSIAQG